MPDYAGAVAAIKAYAAANWAATRIVQVNATPAEPWPPTVAGALAPYVLLEIVSAGRPEECFGRPGDRVMRYEGWIKGHVFVPVASGADVALGHAVAFGEVFRDKAFYQSTPSYELRSLTPYTDGGDSGSDDGVWWRVTATIPFEYWHRA